MESKSEPAVAGAGLPPASPGGDGKRPLSTASVKLSDPSVKEEISTQMINGKLVRVKKVTRTQTQTTTEIEEQEKQLRAATLALDEEPKSSGGCCKAKAEVPLPQVTVPPRRIFVGVPLNLLTPQAGSANAAFAVPRALVACTGDKTCGTVKLAAKVIRKNEVNMVAEVLSFEPQFEAKKSSAKTQIAVPLSSTVKGHPLPPAKGASGPPVDTYRGFFIPDRYYKPGTKPDEGIVSLPATNLRWSADGKNLVGVTIVTQTFTCTTEEIIEEDEPVMDDTAILSTKKVFIRIPYYNMKANGPAAVRMGVDARLVTPADADKTMGTFKMHGFLKRKTASNAPLEVSALEGQFDTSSDAATVDFATSIAVTQLKGSTTHFRGMLVPIRFVQIGTDGVSASITLPAKDLKYNAANGITSLTLIDRLIKRVEEYERAQIPDTEFTQNRVFVQFPAEVLRRGEADSVFFQSPSASIKPGRKPDIGNLAITTDVAMRNAANNSAHVIAGEPQFEIDSVLPKAQIGAPKASSHAIAGKLVGLWIPVRFVKFDAAFKTAIVNFPAKNLLYDGKIIKNGSLVDRLLNMFFPYPTNAIIDEAYLLSTKRTLVQIPSDYWHILANGGLSFKTPNELVEPNKRVGTVNLAAMVLQRSTSVLRVMVEEDQLELDCNSKKTTVRLPSPAAYTSNKGKDTIGFLIPTRLLSAHPEKDKVNMALPAVNLEYLGEAVQQLDLDEDILMEEAEEDVPINPAALVAGRRVFVQIAGRLLRKHANGGYSVEVPTSMLSADKTTLISPSRVVLKQGQRPVHVLITKEQLRSTPTSTIFIAASDTMPTSVPNVSSGFTTFLRFVKMAPNGNDANLRIPIKDLTMKDDGSIASAYISNDDEDFSKCRSLWLPFQSRPHGEGYELLKPATAESAKGVDLKVAYSGEPVDIEASRPKIFVQKVNLAPAQNGDLRVKCRVLHYDAVSGTPTHLQVLTEPIAAGNVPIWFPGGDFNAEHSTVFVSQPAIDLSSKRLFDSQPVNGARYNVESAPARAELNSFIGSLAEAGYAVAADATSNAPDHYALVPHAPANDSVQVFVAPSALHYEADKSAATLYLKKGSTLVKQSGGRSIVSLPAVGPIAAGPILSPGLTVDPRAITAGEGPESIAVKIGAADIHQFSPAATPYFWVPVSAVSSLAALKAHYTGLPALYVAPPPAPAPAPAPPAPAPTEAAPVIIIERVGCWDAFCMSLRGPTSLIPPEQLVAGHLTRAEVARSTNIPPPFFRGIGLDPTYTSRYTANNEFPLAHPASGQLKFSVSNAQPSEAVVAGISSLRLQGAGSVITAQPLTFPLSITTSATTLKL